ncbi:MAG: class I SAM-dependent methyltransferase [Candidatus Wildermuthbacteria bacterium]|nr:class I SAM-dependent methyltransferase [Candidatus Wildermuthbacteria bacterium]
MESNKIDQQNIGTPWDKIYKKYQSIDLINEYIYSRLKDVLGKYIVPVDTILEAGCGSGYMVAYFQQKGHRSVGLDNAPEPLRVAQDVFGVKNVVLGDLFKMPFANSSFDIVWNEGVLEHFPFKEALKGVKEMRRVAKKYVIIDVPNRYSPFVIKKHLMRFARRWQYGFEESYSSKRLRSLMERAGLRVIGEHGIYGAMPFTVWDKRNILPLLFLTIPLPSFLLKRLLDKLFLFEKRYPKFVRMFGFHLLMVGEVVPEAQR